MSIENLFTHRREAEIRHFIYLLKPEAVDSIKSIEYYNARAVQAIADAENTVKLLKEYQQALYSRAQVIYNTNYKLFLHLERCVGHWDNIKTYVITIVKRFDGNNVADEEILREVYEGRDRHKALKRFEALKKEYPNIENEADIAKKHWER